MPEEWFFGNIDGGSSRRGGQLPLLYQRERERSETTIKPKKLSKDSNYKSKLRIKSKYQNIQNSLQTLYKY